MLTLPSLFHRFRIALILVLLCGAAAYGAGTPSQISISSGNQQTGTVGTNIPSPFVALVTDRNGNAVQNARVDWQVTSGGGSFQLGSTNTDARGLAGNTIGLGTVSGYDTATATIHNTQTFVVFGAIAAPGTAVMIGPYSGNEQTGTVGSPLPSNLEVLCKDQYGNNASHTEVDWTVVGGRGSVPSAFSMTSGGIASKALTLGTVPGVNYATATIHGTNTSYTFTATGTAGPPSAINIISGNDQTGAANEVLPNPFVVAVVDAYGNPKSGVQINWAAPTAGDVFSSASTVTNSSGLASSTLTLGTNSLLHTSLATVQGTNISNTLTATSWVHWVVTMQNNATPNPQALQPYFLGLSYMKVWMTVPLFNANNSGLVALFRNLGPGVLRLNAEIPFDPIIWNPSGPGLQYNTVSRVDLARLAGFLKATHWKVIYGIGFVNNTPAAAASEAAVASDIFGNSLLGFEIGNEPDYYSEAEYGYPKVPQLPGYTWKDFISTTPVYSSTGTLLPSWPSFASAIEAAAPNAPLTGPTGGSDWFTPFAESSLASQVMLLTRHFYQGQYTPVLTMDTLLTPDPRIPVQFPKMVQAAAAAGVAGGYRISECNTYTSPLDGVTNALGAALWSIDFLFANAMYQSSGVNFHGGGDTVNYSPIIDNGFQVTGIGPDYYALYAYAQLMKGGALMTTQVRPSAPATFSAYAIQETDGTTDLVLNNKSSTANITVGIERPGTSQATSLLMTGPSLTATSELTLGGSQINTDGSWEALSTPNWPILENSAIVTVPAHSVQIVHLQ